MTLRTTVSLAAVVAAMAGGSAALAGPLAPPAGPIAPTSKTLTEVEPRTAISAANTPGDADSVFRISSPGSYYLTANMLGQAGKHGIEIAAVGVTIDLNGFDMQGVAGSLDGIRTAFPNLRDITIKNGAVRLFGGDGVDFSTQVAANCRVDGVYAGSNGGMGMRLGDAAIVADCTLSNNAADGLRAGLGCLVSGCTASGNSVSGFVVSDGSVVVNCTADGNSSRGFIAGAGGLINTSSARENGSEGFIGAIGGAFSACRAFGNGDTGIATSGSAFECAAQSNGGLGIGASVGVLLVGNTARSNDDSGISANASNFVLGNTLANNGLAVADGAGAEVNNSFTRVEGNHCTSNDLGIDVNVGGNFIIRNTCSGNATNWAMVANNVFGEVSDRIAAGAAAAAVSGDSAPNILGSLGANSHFANFTH